MFKFLSIAVVVAVVFIGSMVPTAAAPVTGTDGVCTLKVFSPTLTWGTRLDGTKYRTILWKAQALTACVGYDLKFQLTANGVDDDGLPVQVVVEENIRAGMAAGTWVIYQTDQNALDPAISCFDVTTSPYPSNVYTMTATAQSPDPSVDPFEVVGDPSSALQQPNC